MSDSFQTGCIGFGEGNRPGRWERQSGGGVADTDNSCPDPRDRLALFYMLKFLRLHLCDLNDISHNPVEGLDGKGWGKRSDGFF